MADDLDGLSEYAQQAAGKLSDVVDSGVLLAAEHAAGALREKVLRVFDTRTGTLSRSWKATFLGDISGAITAIAASDLIYARTLDEGAVIVPKTRKSLAIPLKRNPVGRWPRDHAKGDLFRTGDVLRKSGTGEPLYALKKRVEIRARNYISETSEEIADELADIVGDDVDVKVLEKEPL